MPKRTNQGPPPIFLTANQVRHLIYGTVKNLIDLKIHVDDGGYTFLLILECSNPEGCIPLGQEPKNDGEIFDIICAHTVLELNDFFDAVLSVSHEDGRTYRGFSTVTINWDNIAFFVDCLAHLEDTWEDIDQQVMETDSLKEKIRGKNLVEGNGTIN